MSKAFLFHDHIADETWDTRPRVWSITQAQSRATTSDERIVDLDAKRPRCMCCRQKPCMEAADQNQRSEFGL